MGLKLVFSVWLFRCLPNRPAKGKTGAYSLTRPFFAFPPLGHPIGLIQSNAHVALAEEFTNCEPLHPQGQFRLLSPIAARESFERSHQATRSKRRRGAKPLQPAGLSFQ